MISLIDRLRPKVRFGHVLVLGLLAASLLAASLMAQVGQSEMSTPPAVVKQYIARVYARDYARAYELISKKDQAVKPRENYLRENDPFSGFILELARRLASHIEYEAIQVEQQGDHVTVTVEGRVPDGNAAAVRQILYADPRAFKEWGEELPEAERQASLQKLDRLRKRGQLPMFEVEQTFELVKEQGSWRLFENWRSAVRVHLSGEVKAGLPWEFEPAQQVVRVKPGETARTVYRAKNLSDQVVTAKARHIDKPEESARFMEVVQCFCLIQETLKPGEEKELPLAFRVAWGIPDGVTDLYVHYEFYPIESFPEDESTQEEHEH